MVVSGAAAERIAVAAEPRISRAGAAMKAMGREVAPPASASAAGLSHMVKIRDGRYRSSLHD
jgi:hypothetical protein